MCHQFLCESCSSISWDFCSEASDFHVCPHFSQTTYKTDRRCKSCDLINGAIDELNFWLARHPHREASASDPTPEADDSVSEKSFIDSEEEGMDENGDKAPAKADSPWGDHSQTTMDEEDNKENIDPSMSKLNVTENTKSEEGEDTGDETIDMGESNTWMGL